MNKEKNLIKFLADGKKVPYTFDVNTGIFYLLPLCHKSDGIEWVEPQAETLATTGHRLCLFSFSGIDHLIMRQARHIC